MYGWEPVIVRGARKRGLEEIAVRDWCSCNITLQKGTVGAKPANFCHWLFKAIGAQPDDEFVDVFPGTGAVTSAWHLYQAQYELDLAPRGKAKNET
jgi:hypothetical protein